MASDLLETSVIKKPTIQLETIEDIVCDIYGLQCLSIKELNGYDDCNYHIKVSSNSKNSYLEKVHQDGYILKIVNSVDSKKPQLFAAQTELLIYLSTSSICAPKPVQDKNGSYFSTINNDSHIIRLLEFIPGSILHQVPFSNELFYQVGQLAGQLDQTLKDFSHEVYQNHSLIWHLNEFPKLLEFVSVIEDKTRKKIVSEVVQEFSENVVPLSNTLEKGLIHGDINEQNILVEMTDNSWNVKGILDFGDVFYGCYLYELAITMSYMIIQAKNLEVGRYVLAGYTSIKKRPLEELHLLKICIAARMCQSLVLGTHAISQNPNNSYVLTTAKSGWVLLEKLWQESNENLQKMWNKNN